jgi:hypothetical protein
MAKSTYTVESMSVRQLVSLTGLSDYYLWQIRNGLGLLHLAFGMRSRRPPRSTESPCGRAAERC